MKRVISLVTCLAMAGVMFCGCMTSKSVKSSRKAHVSAVVSEVRQQVNKDNQALVAAIKAKIEENKKAKTKEQRLAIIKDIKVLQAKIAANNKKLMHK